MKQNKTKNITFLVLIALALTIAAITFPKATRPDLAQQPVEMSTAVKVALDKSNVLTDYATINASSPVSFCVFDKTNPAAITALAKNLNSYSFGEPQIFLTKTQTEANGLGVYGWLPDSQKLLLWQGDSDKPKRKILVYDLQSSVSEVYGEHEGVGGATWLKDEKAVLFTDVSTTENDKNDLKIGYGGNQPTKIVASNLTSPFFSLTPAERAVVYSSNPQHDAPVIADISNIENQRVLISGLKPLRNDVKDFSQTVWTANNEKMIFSRFDEMYFGSTTNKVFCQYDLGVYNGKKLWVMPGSLSLSPSQRYLSFIASYGLDLPLPTTLLTVIDLDTGDKKIIDLNNRSITNLSWNSSEDIALLTVHEPDRSPLQTLFLLDVSTGDTKQMLPSYKFFSQLDAFWSPDSTKVVLPCFRINSNESEPHEYRLCMIAVTKQ